MRTLTPGQWYLRFTCEQCQQKEILFADLSHGESKLKATYIVECSSCSHTGSYDGEQIERYQHPFSDAAT